MCVVLVSTTCVVGCVPGSDEFVCCGDGIASAETPNTMRHGRNIAAIFTVSLLQEVCNYHLEGCSHRILSIFDRPRLSQVDRKSTRLNSSHLGISYAVFC